MKKRAKPIPFVRKYVLEHDTVIPDFHQFKHMKTDKLEEYEKYYEEILEALCGAQVWQILDAIEAINNIINQRKGR